MSRERAYREHGIVLRSYKLGEADRIVVLVTQGRGKVRAVAKGVRRTRSKFGARLEPLSHVALALHEGRGLDVVTQAESLDQFRPVREDLLRLSQATAMLEAVDQLAQERESNPKLYQMLLGALRALATGVSPLVLGGFYLKLLALEGLQPELSCCVSCGEEAVLVAFDQHEGGALCRSCRSGVPVTPEALGLMRRILGGQLASVLAEPPSPATYEVNQLATRAMEHHIERRLRSVGLLELS